MAEAVSPQRSEERPLLQKTRQNLNIEYNILLNYSEILYTII